jgi:putative IMPACT (imprinted ancient) family translation regulator
VEVDYAHVDRFYRLLPQYQARVAGEDFGASALFTVELPEDLFEACRDALREATDGASEMMDAGPATEDI